MSKLIESIIENNYKEANDVLKEQIAEIVERKMCEMKKMEAARKSEEQLDEGIMSSIKRIYDKASGNQQERLVGILNQKLDDRQIKTLGHLTKDNKTEQGFKSDYAKLFKDSRYNDLNKRYMRAADPEGIKPYEYFRNKYLSGHKKTNIKESSVSDDIDLVRFAHREAKEVKKRERDKQPKEAPDSYAARFFGNKPKSNKKVVNEISDDLIRRAADSAYDKAVKSKRKGFTTAEKIYNQQGERFDDALEKRRMQDNEKAEMNSLSPAKRRKFFNLKEDAKQDRVSNMMWRDARTAQKAHKQDGEYRAKIALRNKIGSSKYRKNMELSDDNFSISDQQGQIADKHLDGARRDHNRRLEKAVANAKAKGYMQKENIDEGKITKMLPGAIRNLIVKLKAGRHYGKAREKAGEEYSAAVKSKDIMKSYPAAMKMGRLGRKARNPGKEVIEKGKNFFRGEQQNEELMLPSGLVMTSTGEAINQSVVKQRRGQV